MFSSLFSSFSPKDGVHSEKRVRAVFFCVRLSVQDTIRPHGIFVAFCGGAKSRRKRPRGGIRRAGQTAELRRKGAAPDKSGKRYRWAEVVPGCGGGPSGKKGRRNRLRGGRRAVLLVFIDLGTRRQGNVPAGGRKSCGLDKDMVPEKKSGIRTA